MSDYESGEGAAEAACSLDFEAANDSDATCTSETESILEPQKKKAKKRLVKYRLEWEHKHPNIRKCSEDVYKANCSICKKDFSIAYGGERDIKTHEGGSQHKKNASSRAKMATIAAYLQPNYQPEVAKVTAAEVTQVYHAVKHHISYRSLDCGFKLSKVIYPDSSIATKTSCGRTKASSIAKNVLAPLSVQQAYEDLQNGYFSVCSDASNKGSIKLYPLLLRYFSFTCGVTYTLLDFYNDAAETATAIAGQITSKLTEHGLKLDNVAAYCGDNASVNYGRHHSVFQLLKKENNDILPANCPAHILHNCAKRAIDALSIDVESFVLKVYNHFSSAKRTAELKEFFSFVDLEWQPLLRHVPTRWLTLFPAIDRLLQCWPALKSYFLSLGQEKTPKAIWDFLGLESGEATMSKGEVYLFFVHDVLIIFNKSILQLEKDELSAPEVPTILRVLRNNLKDRVENQFFGFLVQNYLTSHDTDLSSSVQSDFLKFLERCIAYLEKWVDFSEGHYLSALEPFCLKEMLSFQQLCKAAEVVNLTRRLELQHFFNEYSLLAPALRTVAGNNLSCAQKWQNVFSKLPSCDVPNIKKLIGFVLSLPGSNAATERIFSQMQFTWTDTRNRCDVELVKAALQIQVNLKHSCADFYSFALGNKEHLKSASSDKKYSFKSKN